MNRDDVTRMAREAGFVGMDGDHGALRRFAALVAAAAKAEEREACAYRASIALLGADRGLANRVDQAIRARGQA